MRQAAASARCVAMTRSMRWPTSSGWRTTPSSGTAEISTTRTDDRQEPINNGFDPWIAQLEGLAEADGNRTRLAEVLGHFGFEDREGHQAPIRLRGRA